MDPSKLTSPGAGQATGFGTLNLTPGAGAASGGTLGAATFSFGTPPAAKTTSLGMTLATGPPAAAAPAAPAPAPASTGLMFSSLPTFTTATPTPHQPALNFNMTPTTSTPQLTAATFNKPPQAVSAAGPAVAGFGLGLAAKPLSGGMGGLTGAPTGLGMSGLTGAPSGLGMGGLTGAPSGLGLGMVPAATTTAGAAAPAALPSLAATAAAPAAAPAPTGFGLKLGTSPGLCLPPPPPATTATAAATSTASTSLSGAAAPPLILQPQQPLLPTLGATSATTTTAAPPPPPTQPPTPAMTFVQLEDMINKWTIELGEQERQFLNQATQINAWDNLLNANCLKLTSLNSTVEEVKSQQKKINADLDFILTQQNELDACLTPLEKEYTSSIYTNDVQREKMYFMAENIDSQLKRMSEDLKETIDHINETSRSQETVDPVLQIGRILNAHMNSLQWIDEQSSKLQAEFESLNKIHENFKREIDRQYTSFY